MLLQVSGRRYNRKCESTIKSCMSRTSNPSGKFFLMLLWMNFPSFGLELPRVAPRGKLLTSHLSKRQSRSAEQATENRSEPAVSDRAEPSRADLAESRIESGSNFLFPHQPLQKWPNICIGGQGSNHHFSGVNPASSFTCFASLVLQVLQVTSCYSVMKVI